MKNFYPRFLHIRARHTNFARRRSLALQHWVNVHQQPIIDDGVVYNITKKIYLSPMVNSRDVYASMIRPYAKPPYNEPRVRVFDPILMICHELHKLLDMSNESVELDLPF